MNEAFQKDAINWSEIPREDWLPHLTLYVFAMRREVTLNRQSITMGASKFRDLDLSGLPGGHRLEAHHGTFFARSGSWFLRIEEPQTGTCLNGEPLLPGEYPLQPGDCLMLNKAVFLTVRQCGFDLVDRSHELDENIELYSDSKSLVNGHAGSRIYFDAARRMIVSDHWSMVKGHPAKENHSEQPVPEHIRTKKQLRQFSGCDRMYPFGYEEPRRLSEDVLLWLSEDKEVLFLAAERKVVSRQWEIRDNRVLNLQETEHPLRWVSGTEKELRDQVRRSLGKQISHNRPGELDDDLTWGEGTNTFLFLAETRQLTRKSGGWGTFVPPETSDSLTVPDWVETAAQLKWYATVRRSDWFSLKDGEQELLTDRLLQRGQLRIDDRILDYETRYEAEKRTVFHTRLDIQNRTASTGQEEIPAYISGLKALKDYVRRNKLYWIN